MPKTPASSAEHLPVPLELIERRIYLIRGQKAIPSTDLAELYQVEPRALVQAMKRNADRFPEDFMFQLTAEEWKNLKSQIVISSWGGARRAAPYAFTEHGALMLSSVPKSQRAVQMSILIIRVFVRLRELLATYKDLARQIEQLQAGQKDHAVLIALVSKDVQTLAQNVANEFKKLRDPRRRKPRIGFHIPEEK